jgi:hypothetical protein
MTGDAGLDQHVKSGRHPMECLMAYCRWSEGDVYAFASSAGGWCIYVAVRRPINVPRDAEARMLIDAEYEELAVLPFAGQTIHEDTLDDFEARLILLRRLGYEIPDAAFQMIERERREEATP